MTFSSAGFPSPLLGSVLTTLGPAAAADGMAPGGIGIWAGELPVRWCEIASGGESCLECWWCEGASVILWYPARGLLEAVDEPPPPPPTRFIELEWPPMPPMPADDDEDPVPPSCLLLSLNGRIWCMPEEAEGTPSLPAMFPIEPLRLEALDKFGDGCCNGNHFMC